MTGWFAGNVFWPMTEWLRRRNTMAAFRELRQSEHFSADQIRQLQAARFRALLKRAADHIPWFARRFHQVGLDVADPHLGLDALSLLPLTTRQEIREHREEMTWHDCPRGGATAYSTGGSSGEPLIFHIDRFRQAADWAARWRARGWWNVQPGDCEVLLWGAPVEWKSHDWMVALRDWLLNQHMLSAFNMTEQSMAAYLRKMGRLQPVCLYGYASSLALLARYAAEQGLDAGSLGLRRLRAIFVTGEVLLERDRHDIQRVFGVPTVIEYGSRDGGAIAFACPCGSLHVADENLIVELLDPDGQPVRPGEVGEVVVTNLSCYAMPFIRYRMGDLARQPSDRRCACGRALTPLAEVRGRMTDQIVCRDGSRIRRMHALSLMYVLREAEGLRQFRIHQSSLDRLDVEIVPDQRFTTAAEQKVRQGLSRRLGPSMHIELHRCEQIEPTASGKHACVVSEVK